MDDVARRNRAVWAGWAPEYREAGRRNWDEPEPRWGIWDVPERQLGVLGDVTGQDVLELGCGTAYWSSWLARRGTRVVGLDNSLDQLTSARELQRERGPVFPLVQADGARVPLRDATFDVVFNEYGAALWIDPERWIAEAARLLRPGGLLAFLTNHVLLQVCFPLEAEAAGTELVRDYFAPPRLEQLDGSIEFHLPHGEWIRLLRRHGFVVEDLIEVRPPAGASSGRWKFVSLEWARRWPSEEIWKARKAG
jgi:SAM-dependent methyltransferase